MLNRKFPSRRQCWTFFLALSILPVWAPAAEDHPRVTLKVLSSRGGRVDWCHKLNQIAFDRKGTDGFYDVCIMKPDGSDVQELTEHITDLPRKNIGQPAWHPAGRYLIVQGEKAEHRDGPFARLITNPGAGVYNDLYLVDVQNKSATLLVEVPNDANHGVLHPHFSADGKLLAWSEMYQMGNVFKKGAEAGFWKLKVADFKAAPTGGALSNVREYQPLGKGFYENHGFSPDGKKLIFTCNAHLQGQSISTRADIVAMEVTNEKTTTLTDSGYNEHAIYSPDGKDIVWMSDAGNSNGIHSTDYWIMNADGSKKRRLTYFNQRGHEHDKKVKTTAADFSWAPNGRSFAAYYHTGLKGDEVNVLIELGR